MVLGVGQKVRDARAYVADCVQNPRETVRSAVAKSLDYAGKTAMVLAASYFAAKVPCCSSLRIEAQVGPVGIDPAALAEQTDQNSDVVAAALLAVGGAFRCAAAYIDPSRVDGVKDKMA